jgi:hypothetical protein
MDIVSTFHILVIIYQSFNVKVFWKFLLQPICTMRKRVDFAIGLAIQFLNCKEHLQFTTFICHEC